MAVAQYPPNLPPPLRTGKSRQQVPSFRAIESYRGQVYVQPTGTTAPVIWDLTFRFDQLHAQIFCLWFETVIARGVDPFTMPIRVEEGLVTHELQFLPEGLLDCTEDGPLFTYRARALARRLGT